MANQDDVMDRARAVKNKYEAHLLAYPNVVGVGVGLRQRAGRYTEELCIVVAVRAKRAHAALEPDALLPAELDGVPVDVVEVGEITAG